MDNLLLGPEAPVNHTIALMRAAPKGGRILDGARPAPQAFFSVDPRGEVEGNFTTGGGNVIGLKYAVRKAPDWLALHLVLGGVDLSDGAVFGVVCKSRAAEATTVRLCLRSARVDGFVDAFFDKHLVAFAEASTHLDLLRIPARDDIPGQAGWRELILFFQPAPAELEIEDLRVFIV